MEALAVANYLNKRGILAVAGSEAGDECDGEVELVNTTMHVQVAYDALLLHRIVEQPEWLMYTLGTFKPNAEGLNRLIDKIVANRAAGY